MIVARWSIDARFGHKQQVIDSLNGWIADIGSKVGWTKERTRVLTGSVGTLESTVQTEVTLKDLGELGAAWDKLATLEAHKAWSKEIEPYVVSGTHRWEVLRVL
ncbi:MAG: hypothetical protein HYZ19_02750 [Rhodocyclales bacterium]|nr:hypothetical protein [Rhodocyclales bacterium]